MVEREKFTPEVRLSLLEEQNEEYEQTLRDLVDEIKSFRVELEARHNKALWWGIAILGTLVVSLVAMTISAIAEVAKT